MGGAKVSKVRTDYLCTYPHPDHTLFRNNTLTWMKDIDDEKFISDVIIPGTHQSISLQGGYAGFFNPAQCQSWTIKDQLNTGVRCFDLRGKCKKGLKFRAYHGIIDQNMDLKPVLDQFYDFLDKFPSEFIIVMLKEEDRETKAPAITQTFDHYVPKHMQEKYWHIDPTIPKVKQMRKKIYLIPRWKYGRGHPFKRCLIQDKYNIDPQLKVKVIEEFRIKSLKNPHTEKGEKFYLNYLSGSTMKNWPVTYATLGNRHFYKNHVARGIIMIDFPGEKLLDKILELNKAEKQFTDDKTHGPKLDAPTKTIEEIKLEEEEEKQQEAQLTEFLAELEKISPETNQNLEQPDNEDTDDTFQKQQDQLDKQLIGLQKE